MPKKLVNAKKGTLNTGSICSKYGPRVLRALFGVRAPFTINVPLTILSSYLPMDYLFQITFDGLFVSDNIYFIQLFKIVSFRYIHEYLFCNEIFVSDTDDFQSICDLL